MSDTHENMYLGVLPKRVVLCCVDNDAYNGAYDKNPFNMKHNGVNFLALYVDGQQVPAKPLQPRFGDGNYVRSYVNLFAGTGKMFQDEGNDYVRTSDERVLENRLHFCKVIAKVFRHVDVAFDHAE